MVMAAEEIRPKTFVVKLKPQVATGSNELDRGPRDVGGTSHSMHVLLPKGPDLDAVRHG